MPFVLTDRTELWPALLTGFIGFAINLVGALLVGYEMIHRYWFILFVLFGMVGMGLICGGKYYTITIDETIGTVSIQRHWIFGLCFRCHSCHIHEPTVLRMSDVRSASVAIADGGSSIIEIEVRGLIARSRGRSITSTIQVGKWSRGTYFAKEKIVREFNMLMGGPSRVV